MSEFQWLLKKRIKSVETDEGQNWHFAFENAGCISVYSQWRILVTGKIVVSSDDHGQKFGLPQLVDSGKKALECLSKLSVTDVDVQPGTLDLHLTFENGVELQIIQLSSGYESWQITGPNGENAVACGSGKLQWIKN